MSLKYYSSKFLFHEIILVMGFSYLCLGVTAYVDSGLITIVGRDVSKDWLRIFKYVKNMHIICGVYRVYSYLIDYKLTLWKRVIVVTVVFV